MFDCQEHLLSKLSREEILDCSIINCFSILWINKIISCNRKKKSFHTGPMVIIFYFFIVIYTGLKKVC